MKVLLIKDVYKLGRAGDIKKVADGYGRNYLLPQKLAILATPGAMKQADQIRSKASANRDALNEELSGVAEQLSELVLTFATKAGETGKLYGSITTQAIAAGILESTNIEVDRRNIETQPIRTLGEHKVTVRLTIDLMPEITVIVRREGEAAVEPDLKEEAVEITAEGESVVESEVESGIVESTEAEEVIEEAGTEQEVVAEASETEFEDSGE